MLKILVVEDDKDLSLAICMRLQSYGYQAISAPDAIAAVSLAVKHKPDLALVDINIPGGNGFTVLDRLNSTVECAAMPTIMMTANKQSGLEVKSRQYGAKSFLEKPFGAGVLLEAVQSAMDDFPSPDVMSV